MGIRFIIKKFLSVVHDSFTAPDGTVLAGRATEEGGRQWVKLGTATAVAGIVGNAAKVTSGTGYAAHVIDAGTPDYTLETTLKTAPAGAASATSLIAFRVDSDGNWWNVLLRQDGTNMVYVVARRDAGTARAALLTTAVTPTAGDIIKVTVSGVTATLTINGATLGTVDMTGWFEAATKVGIGFHGTDTTTAWDDFTVTPA